MNKEAEKKRLAQIVFEGVYHRYKRAYMETTGVWWLIETMHGCPWFFKKAKNQPETTLDWTDTLLRRDDYE